MSIEDESTAQVTPDVPAGGAPEGTPTTPDTPPAAGNESANGDALDPNAGAQGAQGTPPPYVPNLKYKVLNEERTFNEKFKDFIKSQEDEKLVRELYEKADGIEGVKASRDGLKARYKELENAINHVSSFVQKGDLAGALRLMGVDTKNIGSVLAGLGYAKDDIVQHAYGLVQLTPEQEALQNQLREAEIERQNLALQSQHVQSQLAQFQVEARKAELERALSQPDIAPLANAFDKEYGKDAFFAEVANRGALHFQLTKQDLPVTEAIAQIARLAKPLLKSQPPPPPQQVPPVIPVIGNGGGKAIVGQKVTSVDQLRKMAASLPD